MGALGRPQRVHPIRLCQLRVDAPQRGQMRGGLVLSLEDTGSRMTRLGEVELFQERMLSLDEVLARLDAVSRDEVHRLAADLFQRPESMERAAAKAQAELAPGAWLVSLEFAVPGVLPSAQLRVPVGRVVWLYRMPMHRTRGGEA